MWQPNLEPVHLSGALGLNLMPNEEATTVAGKLEAGTGTPRERPTQSEAGHQAPALHHKDREAGHHEAATA
jgi:hypothetical protein